MKRSEMVEKLHEILNSKLYQDYQFTLEELSDLLAELENSGMLPPVTQLKKLGISDNAWEPENE